MLIIALGLIISVKPVYAASLSCSPTSGAVGASVTLTGSAFLPNSPIAILYDGVQAASCTSSATGAFTASLLIPPSVRGAHTITAQDGTNTATTTYTVTPSFTRAPTSGTIGTTITLTGYGFASSTVVTVTWDGSTLTTSPALLITDVKGSFITTFTVPNGGPVTHTVSCSDGVGAISQTYTITRGITLNPVSGQIGTTLSVTGSGFPSSSIITFTFNGVPVTTTPALITSTASGTFIATFTIPSVASGAKTVSTSDNIGGSATATFTVTTSVSLSAATGRAGTAITVTGVGFSTSSMATIKYDGASLLTASIDPAGGFVQVITIPNSPAGPHTISAVDGQGVTSSAAFTVTPSITVSPTSGVVGTFVVVTGSGYSGGSTITVSFAGTTVSTTPSTVTTDQYGAFTASFAVPNSQVGGWSVRAQDVNGLQSVATYTIAAKMTLSSTSGTVGTIVTAKGAGFAPTSQITLTFDSAILTTTPLSVVSDANGRFEASFTIPESVGQAHTIMASDSSGGRISATYTVSSLILLSPTNGKVGANVVISGTGFGQGSIITITFESGITATLPPIVEANSLGSFTASFTVPSASPGARTVKASDNVGGSAQATYTVTPLITITTTGRAGTAVTVTGTGFAPSSIISIKFDNSILASAPTDPTGSFTQVITVPNVPAGSHIISANDPLGAAALATFTVTPLITLSPTSGVVGTMLTVTGAGFTANSMITLTFAGTSVTTTPPSITTDPYGAFAASFAAPNNQPGSWSVRAQDVNGLQSVATYTIAAKMTLSSTSGTVGTIVTAKGAGFSAGSQITMTFDAQILATAPSTILADASGRFEASFTIPESTGQVHTIVASDSTGNRLSSSYTVSASLTLSPISGNTGQNIILTGAGFGPKSLITITFNSAIVATTPTTIETNTQGSFTAVFNVPAATPGANTVRATDNLGGVATATFTAMRKITLSSSSGTPLSTILVTGQGFDPSSTIALTWSGSPLNTVPTPVVTNAVGSFEAIITTPLDVAGVHLLEARDTSGNRASCTYTTIPSVLLDPADQGSGDTLRMVGQGFNGNSPIYVTWDGAPIVTSPFNIMTDPSGSFKARFELPYVPLGNHKVTAVDSVGNYTSVTYTLTSSYPIDISMDVGAIYYRGEIADFLALVSKRGAPVDVTTFQATLIKPDGSTQNLSNAVVKLQKGVYKIEYTVSGGAEAGTYALIVNATVTIQDVSRYGSALKAFQVSRTFNNMNAMLEKINGTLATVSLDLSPILIKLDEVNASLTSLTLTEKNEVLARISSTAGSITSRIDALNPSLESIQDSTATVLTDLGNVKTDLKTIGAQIVSISGNTVHIASLVGSLNASLTDINPKLTGIDEGILYLKTDLGRVNASIQDLKIRAISLEEKTTNIQTDVGSIAMALDGIIGIELPVNTPTGTKNITLLSNMNTITASYMENGNTIKIKSSKNSSGSGIVSVIIPKEIVTSIGSTVSDIKLSDNGREATYTIREFAEVYLVKIAQTQGEHNTSLYLKGYPNPSLIIPVSLATLITLTLIAYAVTVKKRIR